MIYGVEIIAVKDDTVQGKYKTYNYTSDLIIYKEQKELIKEAIEHFKKVFDNYDYLVINKLDPVYYHLLWDFVDNNKEVPEEYRKLFEQSKKEVEDFRNSEEGKKITLFTMMKHTIEEINLCRKDAEELNLLDSQEFLNFLDELNKLSLDPDRK